MRRVLTSHVLPVALPVCRRNSHPRTAPSSCARPSARSFLSVRSAAARAATSWVPQAIPREQEANPLATRVLNRGDAIVAPPGRADDFSWPRADTSASGAVDVGPAPDNTPPKVSTGKNNSEDGNKNGANKPETIKSSDAKNHPAQLVASPPTRHFPAAPSRWPTPPRPPLPVGPAVSNSR